MEKFDVENATFTFFTKHGINSKVNKESLIALYFSENLYQKTHFYEFPLIKELKYKNGAKTKYDIPQYIENMPEEFPVFCTVKEAASIRNIQNKIKKREEKKKKLELKNKEKEKDKDQDKENNNSNIKNNSKINENILDEPIPNEGHKYCHLCKKHFDNYIRHINSKIHKDCTNKYSNSFNNINSIFKRINSFWKDKDEKKDKENKIENNNEVNSRIIEESIVEAGEEDDKFKLKIFTQFNQNVREGCRAKKKISMTTISQLSTAQSLPMIPPKKRKKNENKENIDKSKENKNKLDCNKSINEFLIKGEFVNIKKLNRDNINFYNNYY